MKTVHIIGAGLAGLAASVALVETGATVHLYDAAPQAGGRCRSFRDETLGRVIDNGNHILLGGNRHARDYLKRIGAQHTLTPLAPDIAQVSIDGTRHRLSFPFCNIPGAEIREYLGWLKLLLATPNTTVSACFPSHTALAHHAAGPLATAMLGTPSDEASAALLRYVFMTLLKSGKAGFELLLPNRPLSECFVDPALRFIEAKGGTLHLQHSLKRMETRDNHITGLEFLQKKVSIGPQDQVILSLPPERVNEFLPLAPLHYQCIVNGHFVTDAYAPPITGILGGTAEWLFAKDGMISTTTSAANHLKECNDETLAQALWADICTALSLGKATLPPHRIIREKRANFAATPENLVHRPAMRTRYANLRLAGDATDTGLPASIESAVFSGFRAAAALTH